MMIFIQDVSGSEYWVNPDYVSFIGSMNNQRYSLMVQIGTTSPMALTITDTMCADFLKQANAPSKQFFIGGPPC
jgi:hypothetical protein